MEPQEVTPPPIGHEHIKKLAKMLLNLQQAQQLDHQILMDVVKSVDQLSEIITSLAEIQRKHRDIKKKL